MKKISFIIIFFLCTLLLSGCNLFFFDIQPENEELVSDLISCMEREDTACVKELFAPNALKTVVDIDTAINELFDYYDGEFVSMIGASGMEETDIHKGDKTKLYRITPDVTTTTGVYRMAIEWYVEDTKNNDNIGIWSFYILDYEEDTWPRYSYAGDGLWTNGITVGLYLDKTESEAETLIQIISSGDSGYIDYLFSEDAKNEATDYTNNLNQLIHYIKGSPQSFEHGDPDITRTSYDNSNVILIKMSTDVTTTSGKYRVAFLWCTKDTGNKNNVGIKSIYIINYEDDPNKEVHYTGDGLWTSGIHINKTKISTKETNN